jgi:hypothetical protein
VTTRRANDVKGVRFVSHDPRTVIGGSECRPLSVGPTTSSAKCRPECRPECRPDRMLGCPPVTDMVATLVLTLDT